MTRADETVERAAGKLDETAARAARQGGLAAKLAAPLAEDAAFLRKLKPTLIAARLRGRTPAADRGAPMRAPSGPQLPVRAGNGGTSPFLVLGGALAAGIVIAKLIDWRSHAHPRD